MDTVVKSCRICGVEIDGSRKVYCGDRCKWRANNARRSPDAEQRPERLAAKREARRRYKEKNGIRTERKYPGDPDWRRRPRGRNGYPSSSSPARSAEERAAAKRVLGKRMKHLRRSRNASVQTVRFSAAQLQSRFDYWGNRCWVCATDGDMQIDHVKPLSKGGPNMLSNHRPICGPCNMRKHAKWPYLETLNAPAYMRRGVQ